MSKTKSKKIVLVSIAVVAVIIIIALLLVPHAADLSFADTIVITDEYDEKTVEISRDADKEEFDKIMSLCNKRQVCDPFSIPACLFEEYKLEFKKGSKSVTVYPSNDGCDTMYMKSRFNEVYYYIDDDQKTELNNILDNITK